MVTDDGAGGGSRPRSHWWKVGLGAVVALICVGGVLRLATADQESPSSQPKAAKARRVVVSSTLPGVTRGASFATDGDLTADNEPLWVLERSGRRVTARQMMLREGRAQVASPVTFRVAERREARVSYDITRWAGAADVPALVTVSFDGARMTTNVQEITRAGRVLATGVATVPPPAAGMTRNVAVVRYEGRRPDVVLIDRGQVTERAIVTVVAGEDRFTAMHKRFRLPFRGFSPRRWLVDFVRFDGALPEMFAFRLGRSATENIQFFIAHGEADYTHFTYSPRLAIPSSSKDFVIRTGTRHGAKTAYVLDPRDSPLKVRVVQLVDQTPVL